MATENTEPDKADTGPGTDPPPRPPQSHEEKVIAGIWAELLGVPDPPADVSFFQLGGYSLSLMRVGARLQEHFGLVVPIPDLFENVTVEAQAALVEKLFDQQLTELGE
ncbi:acyl carrier protein [Streptomyces caelestis]|jgi:acyl carrier protein|uniref:Acyl carrier protein n=1 Tax=Streptomyces caelestis TaxID=36816 RepID=A0A7W9HAP8_9ACTN|nr:acyl carrier protein [Streptomyces caelestis]MBB5798526.1 acyl carrier protein [Streptomyces caelestis]GGW50989.1 hypothetical protein GCM10010320_34550 [Streptomyces caelestis]